MVKFIVRDHKTTIWLSQSSDPFASMADGLLTLPPRWRCILKKRRAEKCGERTGVYPGVIGGSQSSRWEKVKWGSAGGEKTLPQVLSLGEKGLLHP